MPDKNVHVKKAKDNETFAATLDESTQASVNWKLIVLFYVAVHYVEAYLAKTLNMHLKSHTTRDSYIARESNLRKIGTQYMHLKFYGYNARYEADQFTKTDVKDAQNYLAQVTTTLKSLL
ncbi:MAG: hypothetical protein ABSE36_18150 [Terracidiphilus sp.]|jgi:hypothetical protein